MGTSEIRPLTGLRGVAACWVVLFHMNQEAGLSGPGGNIVKHGYLAVDMFFVLSGFVMAMSYRHLFEGGFSRSSHATFLLRRFARVWPLYGVATLAYAAVFAAGFGSGRISGAAIARLLPFNLLMVQAWGLGESIDHPAWSISTEFAAYLLFPAFAWAFLFSRPAMAAVASGSAFLILCALPALTRYSGLNGPLDLSAAETIWPLLRCLVEFPLGLAAYRLAASMRRSSMALGPASTWGTATILLGLLTVADTDLVIVGLVPLLLIQLALCDNGVTRLFGSMPIHFLGRISYAIYLLHWMLLPTLRYGRFLAGALSPTMAGVVMQALLYALLIAGSTFAYHAIEVPGRARLKGLAGRLHPRQVMQVERSEALGADELR